MDGGSVRGSLPRSRARRALLKIALGLGVSFPLVQPVAYSAVCTHTACDIRDWQAETGTIKCPCHFSTFDVKDGARVLDGPAPRRLPALPLRMVDGVPAAAGGFVSRVGFQQGG
jgi:Rieske Fe-S protein